LAFVGGMVPGRREVGPVVGCGDGGRVREDAHPHACQMVAPRATHSGSDTTRTGRFAAFALSRGRTGCIWPATRCTRTAEGPKRRSIYCKTRREADEKLTKAKALERDIF
jgi:hypothetical protein